MNNFNKVLVGFLIIVGLFCWINAQTNYYDALCKKYGRDDVMDTSLCPHGGKVNVCGNRVCLKGLGRFCGQSFAGKIKRGECAEGLMCCGICIGCNNGICNDELCQPVAELIRDANNIE